MTFACPPAGGCYLDGAGVVDKLLIISGGSAQVIVKNIRFTGVQSTSDGAVVVQQVGFVITLTDAAGRGAGVGHI